MQHDVSYLARIVNCMSTCYVEQFSASVVDYALEFNPYLGSGADLFCHTSPQALSGIFLGIGGGTAANRQYFVQAEQVYWDYAPQGQYMCDEVPRPFNLREVCTNKSSPRAQACP